MNKSAIIREIEGVLAEIEMGAYYNQFTNTRSAQYLVTESTVEKIKGIKKALDNSEDF